MTERRVPRIDYAAAVSMSSNEDEASMALRAVELATSHYPDDLRVDVEAGTGIARWQAEADFLRRAIAAATKDFTSP